MIDTTFEMKFLIHQQWKKYMAKMIHNIKYLQNMMPLKSIQPWVKNVQNV
jgi:hypothetical protein